MRKVLCTLIAFLLMMNLAVSACAQTDALGAIKGADHLSIDEARTLLAEEASPDSETQQFRQELEQLAKCEGRFAQKNDSTGKVYPADISFYFKQGQPWCHIEYTGYSGNITDGMVEAFEGDSRFRFHVETLGAFLSKIHTFQIEIGDEYLHIAWGDSCDELLERETVALIGSDTSKKPFPETKRYANIIGQADLLLEKTNHHYSYDEETRTLTAYFAIDGGMHNALLLAPDNFDMDALIEPLLPFSNTFSDLVHLAVKEGMHDFKRGHFSFVMVDTLNDKDEYTRENDIIFEVTDGELVFNMVDVVKAMEKRSDFSSASSYAIQGNQKQKSTSQERKTSSANATQGQINALKTAKSYLDFTSFSYAGLISQLEYEGYTASEAKYGADHCGADWYEQAAKKAAEYLEIMPFSRSGLIDQLEYEGFSYDEASYGVRQNGY